MPLFILAVGILLIISAVNNKLPELAGLLKEDFSPSSNVAGFPIWVFAIVLIGLLGYIPGVKPLSNAFLVLLFVGLILANRGFFSKFSSAIEEI